MKTKNIFRTILMALMLVMGVGSVQAEVETAIWEGNVTGDNPDVDTNITAAASWFENTDGNTKIRIYATIANEAAWKLYIGQGYYGMPGLQGVPADGNITQDTQDNGYNGTYFEFQFGDGSRNQFFYNNGLGLAFRGLTITKVSLITGAAISGGGSQTTPKHTISYYIDNELYTTQEVEEGAAITPPTPAAREHYTFAWQYYPATMPAYDLTVSGSYTAVATHTLTYKINNSEVYKTYTVYDGDTPPVEPNPYRKGYRFEGWGNIPTVMPNYDVTVNGNFTKLTYAVTYKIDGEVYRVDSLDAGTAITLPEVENRTGYTYSGWSGFPENMTMPAQDMVVSSTFLVNHHQIVYNKDGGFYDGKYNIPYGTTLAPDYVPATNPTKEGYIFTGWANLPETMPDEDLVIEATFEADADYHVYKNITYYVDYKQAHVESWEVGTTIVARPDSVKEGYTFSGWSGFPEDMVMPNEDLSINGYFTINKYNVIYMVDGEEYKTTEYTYGYDIYAEQYPYREGATFSGWSGLPEDMKMPAHDVVVNGSFGVAQYTISYYINNELFTTQSYDYGAAVTAPEAPVIEGYTFAWGNVPATMPAQDQLVYGGYTINSHDVIYLLDGVEVDRQTYQYGATIYPIADIVREGYTFSGWSGFPEGMTMPDHDVYINGSLGEIVYYTLTFYVNDETFQTVTLPEGFTLPYINSPYIQGYTFTGWDKEVPQTMPAEDMTFHAQFDAVTYTLIFKLDNEDYFTASLAAGETITLPDDPAEREGYTFSGWGTVPSVMPAQNLVIYGRFVKEAEYERLSVGEAGFNTYCPTKALYFQGSEDVKAYIATAKTATQVTLTQVVGAVAPGTGLVLRGVRPNAYADFDVVASGTQYSNNLLVGATSNIFVNSANDYVLVIKDGTVKFADTANQYALVVRGKAYLEIPNASSRSFSIVFSDMGTTAIDAAPTADDSRERVVYNLRGQRVDNPTKGLYIVGGKKVYIK